MISAQIRFQTTVDGKNRLPTAQDLMEFNYFEKGWLLEQQKAIYGIDEGSLYNPTLYKAHYERHNEHVLNYFKFRNDDLLVLTLSKSDAFRKLCDFLGKTGDGTMMPHLNASQD